MATRTTSTTTNIDFDIRNNNIIVTSPADNPGFPSTATIQPNHHSIQGPHVSPFQPSSRPSSIVHQQRPLHLSPIQQNVQTHQHSTSFQPPNLIAHPQAFSRQGSTSEQSQGSYYSDHQAQYPTPDSTQYSSASSPELIAAARMQQRPSYTHQMYHSSQSTSPTSIASPQNHDYNRMYSQPPNQLSQPLQYANYPSINQLQSYGHHPAQNVHQGHGLGGPPMLISQQQNQSALGHQSVNTGHPNIISSPLPKMEASQPRSMDVSRPQSINSPTTAVSPVSAGQHVGNSGPNNVSSAAPGPIPATTPVVVRHDNSGVTWIAFEYSKERAKMVYDIRCDVDNVNIDTLEPNFKAENCVYPRACCSEANYKGNRYHYETECNRVGWALARLNQPLQGRRGLIQRAVDSWRNSNNDEKLRSRRVRRMAKQDKRRTNSNQMHGGLLSEQGGPSRTPTLPANIQQTPRYGGPQMHQHHPHQHHHLNQSHSHPEGGVGGGIGAPQNGPEDVSGMFSHM